MRLATLYALAASFLFLACGGGTAKPLALAEVPAALRKEFGNAKTFLKKTAESIAQQVTKEEFAPASVQLHALLGNTDLTKAQRDVASRALVAVNLKLQELAGAAEPPDSAAPAASSAAAPVDTMQAAEAEAVRQHYILTK